MNDHAPTRVWICPEDAGTYMIPVDVQLPAGSTTLVSFDGEELAVDAQSILPYRVDEEDAHAYLLDQTETALGPIAEVVSQTAGTFDESVEKEVVELFAAILNNNATGVFPEEDLDQLQKRIESGELQAAFAELSGEMAGIIEKLGRSKAGSLEEVLPELIRWATQSSAKPQDWEQLQGRIKDSLDRILKEGVLKNGFPEDYTQV